MSGESLKRLFLGGLPAEGAARLEDWARLEEVLGEHLAQARASWPGVEVAPEIFMHHLAEHLGLEGDLAQNLVAMHAGDLYLACACGLGDREALAALDCSHLANVGAFVAHLGKTPAFVDELRQQLREKLLVSSEGRPKIADYAGRGPLGGWIRVAAVRTAHNMLRGKQPERAEDVEADPASPNPDPELALLKAEYRAEFREAFQATLGGLSADERSMLRLHYLDGLTMEEIASLWHVHKSSVSRALLRARTTILSETRRLLAEKLRLHTAELDSVLGLVRSQLDVSIRRFLK